MRLWDEVEQERFTGLDHGLPREAGADGIVRSRTVADDSFRQSSGPGRLQKLRRQGPGTYGAQPVWACADFRS